MVEPRGVLGAKVALYFSVKGLYWIIKFFTGRRADRLG